jgi:hypothetical protein
MEVIVMESIAFKTIMARLENLENLFLKTIKKVEDSSLDRWMSVEEVAEFTGFSKDWVYDHKEDIGFFHNGGHLKFWKPDVTKFMELRSVKPRINKTLLKLQK